MMAASQQEFHPVLACLLVHQFELNSHDCCKTKCTLVTINSKKKLHQNRMQLNSYSIRNKRFFMIDQDFSNL
jgi:hypothetical protein